MSVRRKGLLLSLATLHWIGCQGWAPVQPLTLLATRRTTSKTRFFSTPPPEENNEETIDRTSFDQAGASLIEEEDRRRLEQMGDFDENDSVGDECRRDLCSRDGMAHCFSGC